MVTKKVLITTNNFCIEEGKKFQEQKVSGRIVHTRHLCSSLTGDIFSGPGLLPYRRMDCGCVSGRGVRRRSGTAVEPVCTADHFFG
jgi:hypothetical protein